MPLTHVDANTFSTVLFPESPNDRSAITFTVDDGTVTGVDIGDGDGPGTGQRAGDPAVATGRAIASTATDTVRVRECPTDLGWPGRAAMIPRSNGCPGL